MNRRTFLRTLGAVGAALVLPVKWVAEQVPDYSFFAAGRASGDAFWSGFNTVRIAAANASAGSKAAAHLVATGADDQATFDEAYALLPDGGTILLSEGDYHIPNGLRWPNAIPGWTIEGSPDYRSVFRGDL